MLQGTGQHNQTSRSHLSDAENEEVEVFFIIYILIYLNILEYMLSLALLYSFFLILSA